MKASASAFLDFGPDFQPPKTLRHAEGCQAMRVFLLVRPSGRPPVSFWFELFFSHI